MAEDWVDFDLSLVAADKPFHSALALYALRGNLDRTLSESGYRYQSIAHGSTQYASSTFSASDEFEDLTDDWGAWLVPIRYAEGSLSKRQLRVVLTGKVLTDSLATVRVYALPSALDSLDPDTASGLLGVSSYGEVTMSSSSSFTTVATTITVSEASLVSDSETWSEAIPASGHLHVALQAIAKTSKGSAIHLRPPMIEEIP